MSSFLHKRIESQEDLVQAIEKESKALRMDPSKICPFFIKDIKGMYHVALVDDKREECGKYPLLMTSSLFSTVATVRHELYHIKKNDFRKEDDVWYRVLVAEPRATLYGGLKIAL